MRRVKEPNIDLIPLMSMHSLMMASLVQSLSVSNDNRPSLKAVP